MKSLLHAWRRGAAFAAMLLPLLASAETYAPFRPDMPAGAACAIAAERLHPTQFSLGFREVAYKTRLMNRMSVEQLADYLKRKDVPVIIGPEGLPYLTDGHHTVRALIDSCQRNKTTYGHIVANWSGLTQTAFWRRMIARHYVYLSDARGRGPLDPAHLPASVLLMQSDPCRSLAWAVKEHGGFQDEPAVLYQEFYWADYFREKVRWDDRNDADFKRAVQVALVLAHESGAAGLPGYLPKPGK